ncbi:MAG: alpha/beta fold hydrolase [Pseudomonadota bacterium]
MRETTFFDRLTIGPAARIGSIGGMIAADSGVVHYLADGRRTAAGSLEGAGSTPVVLLHGASGNLRDFAISLLPSLARHRHTIALDRPGFGHSSRATGSDLLSGQVRVLRRALRRLGHRRYHLVGHSYGGAVALDWALRHPEDVASLGLVSAVSMDWGGHLAPFYRLGRLAGLRFLVSQMAPFAPERFVAQTLQGVFAPAPVPERYREEAGIELALRPATFRLNQRQITTLYPQILEQVPQYGRLRCPVAILHGTADEIVPAAVHAGPLAERLATARLTLLPGAGHMPHHTHREAVTEALLAAMAEA